ncbi:MAG: hypothetical protein OXU51_12040 [Candidatus Poribacteria bacterium]|nr:hypothetical protein [Candidatus Poribacteria bacterium]
MGIPKNGYEQAAISLAPIETDMTLDEFCQSDLEDYEYFNGALIPIALTTMEHGEISMNLSSKNRDGISFSNRHQNAHA